MVLQERELEFPVKNNEKLGLMKYRQSYGKQNERKRV